jgi:hypothetical protein
MSARRWLVLPLLSPLLAVLVVAALNPGPRLSFRVLTWETPRAPLGLWLAGAALGGAALSGGAAGLALRQEGSRPGRRGASPREREREREPWSREPWSQDPIAEERWAEGNAGAEPGWQRQARAESPESPWNDSRGGGRAAEGRVSPFRALGDPAPTVVVPFRVLRRPGGQDRGDGSAAAAPWSQRPVSVPAREPVAVEAIDDWGDGARGEEW